MASLSTAAVIVFASIICIKELPKMLKAGLIKELVTFCILLALGTGLTIMKIFGTKIPNPSDLVKWIYSPLSDFMNSLIK
jgi:hypothetical protein